MGFFSKIKEGLKKTRNAVVGQIDSMLKSFTKIDDELFEELEEQRFDDDFALSLVVLEDPQFEQFSAVFVSLAFLFLPNIFHLLKFCKFCLLI